MNGNLGGVYLAIVEDNRLDERGRVSITIPYSDHAASYPAYIASFMAGDQRGALFLPEKKDQVLVAFVNGVSDAPVIIGNLWSQTDKPPESNSDGENDVKLIKTRAGNQIRITDKNSAEKIEISGKEGKVRVVLDIANKTIEITTEEKVTAKAKKITLDGDVNISGKLIVGSSSKTTIDGNKITGS
jgi:uncharacterized protein involved in type VI secretion and phage assembly